MLSVETPSINNVHLCNSVNAICLKLGNTPHSRITETIAIADRQLLGKFRPPKLLAAKAIILGKQQHIRHKSS